jgi:hypothetical protein
MVPRGRHRRAGMRILLGAILCLGCGCGGDARRPEPGFWVQSQNDEGVLLLQGDPGFETFDRELDMKSVDDYEAVRRDLAVGDHAVVGPLAYRPFLFEGAPSINGDFTFTGKGQARIERTRITKTGPSQWILDSQAIRVIGSLRMQRVPAP